MLADGPISVIRILATANQELGQICVDDACDPVSMMGICVSTLCPFGSFGPSVHHHRNDYLLVRPPKPKQSQAKSIFASTLRSQYVPVQHVA